MAMILPFIPFAIFVAFFLTILFYSAKSDSNKFNILTSRLTGTKKGKFFSTSFAGEQDGQNYQLDYVKGKNTEYVTIKVEHEFDFKMNIYKKAFGVIMLHRIDLEGEPAYEKVLVSVPPKYEDSARNYLQNKTVKDDIKWLFDNVVGELNIKEKYIFTRYDIPGREFGISMDREIPAGIIAEIVKRICEMAK